MTIETAELLANLTPDTQESLLWKSRGAIPKLHPETIAFALGRVKKKNAGAVYLLRIKYAGDDCWKDLERRLWMRVIDLANRQKWKYPAHLKGTEFYRRMCRLAAWEHIHHHVCPACLGRAQALIDNKLLVCESCNGSAHSQMTDDKRAEFLGVDNEFWSLAWSTRYSRIRFILNQWEESALNIVRNSI